MTVVTLELNDSEIRVARDTEILVRTPGYAVLGKDSVVVGDEAVRRSHLTPRETSNRFWSNLGQDPLAVQSSQARHNADLAYRQLLAIHEWSGRPGEVIFSVPGSYSAEQLSLLLGIVESCPFAATGLVDTAVAAAAAVAGRGDYVHVDIHLHQTILTRLSVAEEVSRDQVQLVDDCGITDIHDSCAVFIADLFIQQSRFDPLHHARTEQSLYDEIPGVLSALNDRNEVSLEIQYEQTRHQVRVFREPLLEALEKHYARILNAINDHPAVLLGDRLGALPGFRERLRQSTLLRPDSVFQGIHANHERIYCAGPPLSFITSLPASREPEIVPASTARPAGDSYGADAATGGVSHILINHRAIPLGNRPLFVSANGSIDDSRQDNSHCSITLSDQGVSVKQEGELSLYVNGHRINGESAVRTGDTLSFAGSDTTFRFIHVQQG